jgi:hypothetical protein
MATSMVAPIPGMTGSPLPSEDTYTIGETARLSSGLAPSDGETACSSSMSKARQQDRSKTVDKQIVVL